MLQHELQPHPNLKRVTYGYGNNALGPNTYIHVHKSDFTFTIQHNGKIFAGEDMESCFDISIKPLYQSTDTSVC